MANECNSLDRIVWKDTSTPNIQVSSLGAIRRKSTRRIYPQHLMGPKGNEYYYCAVSRARKVRVSVFICEAFHGPRPSKKHFALHCNGDRFDNRASNLRWGTQKENRADMFEHGTVMTGEKNPNAVLTEAQVREIRRLLPLNRRRGQLPKVEDVARRFGISSSLASLIGRRKAWGYLDD